MDCVRSILKKLLIGKLTKAERMHLFKVYSMLCGALVFCASGACLHLFSDFMISEIAPAIASTVLQVLTFIALCVVAPSKQYQGPRIQLLLAFAFLTGLNFGPQLGVAVIVNPRIITDSLFAACLTFLSFSLASFLVINLFWLCLGGILLSGFCWFTLFLVLDLFIGSQLVFQIYPFAGLFLMCAFITYHNQQIVEQYCNGDDDFVKHSIWLFCDFTDIFRLVLTLLTRKGSKKITHTQH